MSGCLLAGLLIGAAKAAPVVDWFAIHSSDGTASAKPSSALNTDSPILGNGTNASAAQVALWADIAGPLNAAADVSLANGQRITLSGSATFTGIVSSMEQFRWGLFNDQSQAPFDAFGWGGYMASQSAGTGGGNLRAKNYETATTFAQTGGGVSLQVAQDGDPFVDGTYSFRMSVSRFENELSIDASLTNGTTFLQKWQHAVAAAPNPVLFDFNRVGFLSGSPMSADRIEFRDIDVSVDAAEALTLEVTTDGPYAGLMRLCNHSGASHDVEYYEVTSADGSLNPGGWNSLDDREGSDPELQGWDEVPASNEHLLSEIMLGPNSFTTMSPSSSFSLGSAFNVGGTEDLKFFFGLADGTLARGIVQYVESSLLPGDYNGDGYVDAADYVLWRKNNINGAQGYTDWRNSFGASAGSGGGSGMLSAVPEPAATGFLSVAGVILVSATARCRTFTLSKVRLLSIALGLLAAMLWSAGTAAPAWADEPIVKFVSVPDFINMDLQLDDPRLFNLTNSRQAQLVAEINSSGPQASINPNVGNFVGTVENGYYGASQVLLESLAAENADFFTVSGDLLYTRWPKGSQLGGDVNDDADHIRAQADIYYDGWIENVGTYAGFDLDDVYTIVGDHEVGDNDWPANKRPLIPTYREVYVDKVGNESAVAGGAYVNAPAGFEGRTYAVKRGNLLLIGLDQFETFTSSGVYTNVGSQMASVKIDVTGNQLTWLENTLTLADNDPTIDHVIVLAHAPIAAPDFVKVQATSSALRNATDADGPLWQTLAAHGVDLYMPGEVHEISMQLADDVLQLVTGTNIFQPADQPGVTNIGFNLASPVTSEQNYVVVEVYEDRIDIMIKQIETKIWGNRGASFDPLNDDPYKNREARVAIETAEAGFQVTGTLTIDTSNGTPLYRNRSGLFLTEWTFGAPINIDLNGDNQINLLDALRFLAHFHTDLSGLTAAQAFSRGDVNGDFLSNHADFRIFKVAYNEQLGEGAFEAAMAMPEPSAAVLAALGAAACLAISRIGGRAGRAVHARPSILRERACRIPG